MNSLINNFKRKCFFEGWYFKHQNGKQIIAFIPSFNIETNGKTHVFIQIIMNENSYTVPFSVHDCSFDSRKLIIKIGKNIFCKKGIKVDIKIKEITIKGILRYGKITPIRYTIMGFFRYFPLMECKHEIISMYHQVKGNLNFNEKKSIFKNGIGYVEKDLGYSFPKNYQWIQCNYFPKDRCSIFISIADIPYHGIHFKGCICAVQYRGREYRLATYLGVKIIYSGPEKICLKQGNYLLIINLYENGLSINNLYEDGASQFQEDSEKISHEFSHNLFAPVEGDMSRTIKEQHLCAGRFVLFKGKHLILDLTSRAVSHEYVE